MRVDSWRAVGGFSATPASRNKDYGGDPDMKAPAKTGFNESGRNNQ